MAWLLLGAAAMLVVGSCAADAPARYGRRTPTPLLRRGCVPPRLWWGGVVGWAGLRGGRTSTGSCCMHDDCSRANCTCVPHAHLPMQVSLEAVKEAVGAVEEVQFVLFQTSLFDEYVQAAARLFPAAGDAAGECAAEGL